MQLSQFSLLTYPILTPTLASGHFRTGQAMVVPPTAEEKKSLEGPAPSEAKCRWWMVNNDGQLWWITMANDG